VDRARGRPVPCRGRVPQRDAGLGRHGRQRHLTPCRTDQVAGQKMFVARAENDEIRPLGQ
jgi:hypothetical protein